MRKINNSNLKKYLGFTLLLLSIRSVILVEDFISTFVFLILGISVLSYEDEVR